MNASKRQDPDKVNPCLLCGWAEHMGVHRFDPKAQIPAGSLLHTYVPWSIVRNKVDKPPADASVFARAAWFLADYAELWYDVGPHEGDAETRDNGERCLEMIELARRLRELDEGWKGRADRTDAENAAEIIAGMLQDWKLPGAVYWSAMARRWRVVGAEYRPQADDVLVGVYAPGVEVALLREDLDAIDAGVNGNE